MNTQRLLALADHLEKGKLLHEVFDFSTVNSGHDHRRTYVEAYAVDDVQETCGTNGCAMGELPAVDPDYWEFSSYTGVRPKDKALRTFRNLETYVCDYFSIDPQIAKALFWSHESFVLTWCTDVLGDGATAAQVAQSIRNYVRYQTKFDNELAYALKPSVAIVDHAIKSIT